MKKFNKRILSLILAVVFAISLSVLNVGLMIDDGPVTNDDGKVVGYWCGGLYWDAEEYEAMSVVSYTKKFVINGEPAPASLTEEDATIIADLSHPLGMAIAAGVDEDGNRITYLGGYTFVEEEGTSLGGLMRRLEDWDATKSPYRDMFFSTEWIYKSIKVAEDKQEINVDTKNNVIEFRVNKDVSGLDQMDLLSAMRSAVIATEIATEAAAEK